MGPLPGAPRRRASSAAADYAGARSRTRARSAAVSRSPPPGGGPAPHRPLDRLLLLGGESDRGPAALELLHVDPRVVPPLDRGHDDAAARPVEQGERRRLVPARVLVGVVT